MLWAVHFLASLGSGIASLAFPVFPGVTWQWRSIIGIPCVSLSVPSVFCSVLVGFPSWLAMFVVPACWLACFAARPGCDNDGVHLPQTSGFSQWTSGLSILLVLWTSES